MNLPNLRDVRRLARELRLPAGAAEAAVDCGALAAGQSPVEHWRALRQMRRLMDDLGVNAPAAALLVRMAREMQAMQAELARLSAVEARYYASWEEAEWYDA